MRLYDFHCDGCGKEFEDLVQDVADARCPACASDAVTKKLSGFSVGGSRDDGGSFAGCGSGACGGGGCGFN